MRFSNSALCIALLWLFFVASLLADEPVPFDLSVSEIGEEPEGGFVMEGDLKVIEVDELGRGLEIAPEPLVESGMLLGETARGRTELYASVLAEKQGRSRPRFGIGAHGVSGYRLRVVPASKKVELVYKEKVVSEVPFVWESGLLYTLRLVVEPPEEEGGKWTINGYVWSGEEEPKDPTISAEEDELRGQGKASIWGTPYAGTPIQFFKIAILVDSGK